MEKRESKRTTPGVEDELEAQHEVQRVQVQVFRELGRLADRRVARRNSRRRAVTATGGLPPQSTMIRFEAMQLRYVSRLRFGRSILQSTRAQAKRTLQNAIDRPKSQRPSRTTLKYQRNSTRGGHARWRRDVRRRVLELPDVWTCFFRFKSLHTHTQMGGLKEQDCAQSDGCLSALYGFFRFGHFLTRARGVSTAKASDAALSLSLA